MDLPKRKHPRLKNYDYSQSGFYYVTIHIIPNGDYLSKVVADRDYNTAEIVLTESGKIAENELKNLSNRFAFVRVDKYVIMPTHIHLILEFMDESAGASPRPTLMNVVGAYKSLTTREYNQKINTTQKKLFQASFYEAILRNDADYRERWKYIDENPLKWSLNPEDL